MRKSFYDPTRKLILSRLLRLLGLLYCDSAETRKLLATGRFMDSSGGHDSSPIFVRC